MSDSVEPAPSEHTSARLRAGALSGGAAKYHDANAAKGKLFARERISVLVDDGSFVEDGAFANVLAGDAVMEIDGEPDGA